MAEIYFKASRKSSNSHPAYRQIVKRGDLELDMAGRSDDAVLVYVKGIRVGIDCDKKTGEFRLFWSTEDGEE